MFRVFLQAKLILLSMLFSFLLAGCSSLPKPENRTTSYALTDTSNTELGRATDIATKDKGEQSGFTVLDDGLDAFAARVMLIKAAERSIDLQYYIWNDDIVGKLLGSSLIEAAERGVRVRILLDDHGSTGVEDTNLARANSHPNIEIRLFNPVIKRNWRNTEWLFDFSRLNRRMHNKSFTVDNQMTIVGSRNISSEYYNANPNVSFQDFDVLALGPIVDKVSQSFDTYWNSPLVVPVSEIIEEEPALTKDELVAYTGDLLKANEDSPYVKAIKNSDFIIRVKNDDLDLYWGKASLVFDDPHKIIENREDDSTHLLPKLKKLIGKVDQEMILISPYFVPSGNGVEGFKRQIEQGVKVKILTNSLASTDVNSVYAGYSNYQVPLLEAGVELYEMRPDTLDSYDEKNKKLKPYRKTSRKSLHMKLLVFDRTKLFVGSFNLDPRSSEVNTEIGIVIDNPELATKIAEWWDSDISQHTYTLALSKNIPASDDDSDSVVWIEKAPDGDIVYEKEPKTSFWRRLGTSLLSILPIESQL